MKKSLIALAAVAATGASFAQSSVTLSGLLDVGVEKRFSGDAVRVTSGRNATANWTLAGTEDLGGGLKAVFKISTAFNTDDGTTAANAFGNNDMFVGLTGGFGTLRAGRPVNTLYANAVLANGTKGVSLHDANSLLVGNAAASGSAPGNRIANAGHSVFVSNAVQYHSPIMAGFQVQVEYAPSELTGAKAGAGVALRYVNGPIVATLTNYKGAGTAGVLSPKAVNQIAAGYDFGVARVVLTYRDQGGLVDTIDNSYALGVTAPVGPGTLYASYNVSEQVGKDANTIIAGYKYNLSKRTLAYVNVANRNKEWSPLVVSAGNTVPNKSSTGFGVGLQHSF